ncbi:CBS domain-containing protein [Actinoplanes sp. KI2]|uniref:CBS domain-containing protein n=1 Tax=Actinoplanes sp. KI2 TaxID=2983315 RepID=UPI0021D59454|nr:CBS domain-containing protein [Actinoplanes sp. KI2]MCU7730977.1 CBS domain-containing protein [Actinoplanes sp. KI2]
MRQWTVRDVMTSDVVTAGPDASISELAGLLTRERISAVPVVADDGRLLGVVSEADLAAQIPHPRTAPHRTIVTRAPRAKDLMSGPVRTAAPDELLSTAARRMRRRNVRRLIVTDDTGRVLAVVSRADLMRLYTRDDEALRREVIEQVLRNTLWIGPSQVRADVEAGVVTLTGEVGRRSTAQIASRLTADVPGVSQVIDDIAYRFDDTALVRSRVGRTHPFSAEPFGP